MARITTGIILRGFSVEAEEPHHYRHYHTLFLRSPNEICQFEVGYKKTDAQGEYLPFLFCERSDPTAKAWGATWIDNGPLHFQLIPEEAEEVIRWREEADARWFAKHPDFKAREEAITSAQVHAAARADLPSFPTEQECWECGAVYDEPGHVDAGSLGCKRCN